MFSKHSNKNSVERSLVVTTSNNRKEHTPSIIAANLIIDGDLECENEDDDSGSIEVEGRINGNVRCHRVVIRRSGFIKGNVTATIVQVDGEINGLVKGKNITLSETGKIIGTIMYEALSVKDGAYIDGQCKNTEKLNNVEAIEMQSDTAGFIERSVADERVAVEV